MNGNHSKCKLMGGGGGGGLARLGDPFELCRQGFHSWQVQPCRTGHLERTLTKTSLQAFQIGG